MQATSVDGSDGRIVSVSAQEAATWLTGTLQNENQLWPACQALGKCLDGFCALAWDHPACCYVPSRSAAHDGQQLHGTAEPFADAAAAADVTLAGYWRSKNWFCWR